MLGVLPGPWQRAEIPSPFKSHLIIGEREHINGLRREVQNQKAWPAVASKRSRINENSGFEGNDGLKVDVAVDNPRKAALINDVI